MVVMPFYPYVLKDLVSNFAFDDDMTKDELCALVILQLCLGVEHLQAEAVAHRDLKADNVFVTSDGILAIGDYGTARWLNQDPGLVSGNQPRDDVYLQDPKEQINRDIGVTAVQAPELWKWMQEPLDDDFQINRQHRYTLHHVYHKTDVYAVGIMMMELFGLDEVRPVAQL